MRIFIALVVITFCVEFAFAGEGILFLKDNYELALDTADDQDKFLFLDFTASWCKPCKRMELETFSDRELGQFVNEHFVSFRVDCDYIWGRDLASDFNVKAYPTLLVIDHLGRVVKRITGFQTADILLRELEPLPGLQ